MVTLIIIALCLWAFGWLRTLTIYVAIIAMVASLICTMVAGAGLSYLFWSETVRAFQIGEFWSSMFVERDGFALWEAGAVPVLFFFDLIRVCVRFVWQCPNIFSIGTFACWLYMMNILWGIVLRMVYPKLLST